MKAELIDTVKTIYAMTSISQYNVVNCGSGEGNEGANLGQLMTQFNAVKNIS